MTIKENAKQAGGFSLSSNLILNKIKRKERELLKK
jgi:hypothetical protein